MFTKTDIEKYFLIEKQVSGIVLLFTIVFFIAGILVLLYLRSPFYKGIAIPLLLFAIIAGTGSFVVYKQSDGYRIRNVYAYDMNPGQLKNEELPRAKKIIKKFTGLRYFEIALVLAGAALFIYFRNDETAIFWKGFGLSLVIFALIGLSADSLAIKRGQLYLKGLESFVSKK